jgi:hypothetical protein
MARAKSFEPKLKVKNDSHTLDPKPKSGFDVLNEE